MTSLIHFDAAKRELMLATRLDEVKQIRDKAEALRHYVRQQGESAEMQNYCAEIKIRAERKAGEMLRERNTELHPVSRERRLPDGITAAQSHRWQQAATVPEEVLEEYIAETKEKGGEITSAGVRRLVVKEQQKESDALREQIAAQGSNALSNGRWTVETADIKDYQTREKFDFIITDPPYPKEYLPLYSVLAVRAKEWLRPDGLLLVMCGQSYLDKIFLIMCEHLTYYWTGCYLTLNRPTPLRQRQVNTSWKPILIFGNSKYSGKTFGDVWRSERNEKTYHEWEQSESGMFAIISQVCRSMQTIFDPFCGAGTTGVAALKHGCLFHGIDISEKNVNISRQRLEDACK